MEAEESDSDNHPGNSDRSKRPRTGDSNPPAASTTSTTPLEGPYGSLALAQKIDLNAIESVSRRENFDFLFKIDGTPKNPTDVREDLERQTHRHAEQLLQVAFRMQYWWGGKKFMSSSPPRITEVHRARQPQRTPKCYFCENVMRRNEATEYVTAGNSKFHLVCAYVYAWLAKPESETTQ